MDRPVGTPYAPPRLRLAGFFLAWGKKVRERETDGEEDGRELVSVRPSVRPSEERSE